MSDAKFSRLKDCVSMLPKSKILAGGGTPDGKYPFYLSGQEVGRINEAMSSEDAVVMGTGGVATAVFAQGEYAYSSGNFAFKSGKKNLRIDYLFRALESFLPEIDYKGFQGSGLKHLDKPFLFNLRVAILPLTEQKKIAATLSSVDEVLANVQKQINKIQDLKKATMEILLSQGVNRARLKKGWAKIKMGEIGKFSSSSVDKKSVDNEHVVSLLNFMDVFNHSVLSADYPFQKVTAPSKQKAAAAVRNGDVFFMPSSETPDDIGRSAVFLGDAKDIVHSYHTVRFRPFSEKHLDDSFKAYAFQGAATFEYFRKRATGSTRFTLSLPTFRALEVTLPPLAEQRRIAAILSSMDDAIETKQRKWRQTQALKKALMQHLLTGKIRV